MQIKTEFIFVWLTVITFDSVYGLVEPSKTELAAVYSTEPNEIQQTIEFLEQGESVLKIDDNYRDVILMIGNTGTGKSALTRFVAGDLADLESVGETSFIIKYRYEGVIGESTTVSQTIYPELVIDETYTAFYDCPGYADTRNMSIEVASTYFVKKVMDHADSLKIVLVANHDAVQQGGSRRDFLAMLEHVQRFMKNLKQYENSIALVATKVENQVIKINGSFQLVPDEAIISNIALFLTELKTRLLAETKTEFNTFALALLDVLLRSNDGGSTYEKIAIFRKPDEPGPLDKIESMVKGRAKIRNVILSHTNYSPKGNKDFGYTISETSRLKLISLVSLINTNIKTNVQNIGAEIINNFVDEADHLGNLVRLTHRFGHAYELLTALKANETDARLLVTRLIAISTELQITISHEYLDSISDQDHYISFIKIFTTDELPINRDEWLTGLHTCTNYLEEMKNWFKFLSDIKDDYSRYEKQNEVSKYNVSDINDWGVEGRPQGIFINANNFWKFVEKQSVAKLIKNEIPTASQLNTLNNLLEITIRQRPIYSCDEENGKMTITGHFIQFRTISLDHCKFELKLLQMFATDTVYIDTKWLLNDTNVVIVSPTWYIWGDQIISLSRRNNTNVVSKPAVNGNAQNVKGEEGIPGRPGYRGTDFTGIGDVFISGDRLEIISTGGKGARGQDGGVGHKAGDADISVLRNDNGGTDSGETELKEWKFYKIKDVTTGKRCEASSWTTAKACSSFWDIYAQCGGSGGDGGVGGYGGNPGSVNIFELGIKCNIGITRQNGSAGDNGIGGAQGRNPQIIKILYRYVQNLQMVPAILKHIWSENSRRNDDTCTPLKQSTNGGNRNGITEASTSSTFDLSITIGEYLGFVRENQKHKLLREDLLKFVDLITTNPGIATHYTIKGFVNEINVLENQFYRLGDEIELLTYYKSLASRIEKFAAVTNVNTEKILLNYLYTSAWGKYLTLRSKEANLIIDIKEYLDLSMETIRKVESSVRKEIITKYQQDYKKNIDAKIQEASGLINTDILPEIDKITSELDDTFESILKETVELRKKAQNDTIAYKKQQGLLAIEAFARTMNGGLKAVATYGSYLGPHGAAIGSIVGVASQISEGFITDSRNRTVLKIPDGVKNSLLTLFASMKKYRDEKVKLLTDELQSIVEASAQYGDILSDMTNSIKKLQEELQVVTNAANETEITFINEIETKLVKLIDNHKSLLEKKTLNDREKAALKLLLDISNRVSVLELSPESHKKYKDDKDRLDEICLALKRTDSVISPQLLVEFERQIYETMWPMIRGMFTVINELEQGTENASLAVHALNKWKIQSILRDTKLKMNDFIKGFMSENKLLLIFQKLDEAYATLIAIYDSIENYRDQAKLSDFIGSIATVDVNTITVNDPVLDLAFKQLDVVVTSNVLLTQYKAAISAIKQLVFPFAEYYFDQFQLPKSLEIGNSVSDLAREAIKQLDSLRTKIIEKRITIGKIDEVTISTTFDSRIRSSQPFFTWPSKQYRNTINDLLSGKLVLLRADIKEAYKLNAVKFNLIDLFFHTPDPSRQTKLNDVLLNFDVIISHMGNSYYRCGASFYTINSPKLTIVYSNEKINGTRVRQNEVYMKLLNGDILLSPYTMWTIKLENKSTMKDELAFQQLSAFTDRTDLVLVGQGKYVDKNAEICKGPLDEYYQEDDTSSVVSLNNVINNF